MRVLLTGANGQLGQVIQEFFQNDSTIELLSCLHQDLDITHYDQVEHYFKHYQPDVVINAAAYTNVDEAEQQKELAFGINAIGAFNVAQSAWNIGAKLVHISTDYVFNSNEVDRLFSETDFPEPANYYGYSKLSGEQKIQEVNEQAIIIRTSWLYSDKTNKNFFMKMNALSETRGELTVVNDQIGAPTSAYALTSTIYAIIQQLDSERKNIQGIFHYSQWPICSWYDFAKLIIDEKNKYTSRQVKVRPILAKTFPTKAIRPICSALNNSKITSFLGISPSYWADSVKSLQFKLYGDKI